MLTDRERKAIERAIDAIETFHGFASDSLHQEDVGRERDADGDA